MHPTIYLDISVIECLTDPPSANSITRACQQLTQLWWDRRCDPNQTFISEYVISDIADGDPLYISRRMQAIQHLPLLAEGKGIDRIAELLVLGGGLTATAMKSAKHIACAASNKSEVLLTWNCRDIANAEKFPLLRLLAFAQEVDLPDLVTPFELMENSYEDI